MYTTHFGLKAAPFSITPDPHYLYLSVRHREALAHLLYGVNEGPGFVLLTGEVGTGKTTLCRSLIEQLPETVDVALLLNPRLSPMELLSALFDELRISHDPQHYTPKDYIDTLSSYLLTAHSVNRRTVLILDEAQNLTIEVLEQVRLLTNLETSNQKLLQIILVGQPELNKLIKRNTLRQLAQRITARYHLLPLSSKDTKAYINHRLAISGARSPLFTNAAIRLVYRHSAGVPRLINIICDRALLGGYVNNKNQIDKHIVHKAIQEVRGESLNSRHSSLTGWLVGTLATALLFGVLMWGWHSLPEKSFFKNLFISPVSLSSESSEVLPQVTIVPPEHVPVVEKPVKPIVIPTEPPQNSPVEPPKLLELLEKTSTESAFITLFNLWKLDYTSLEGEKACQRAATQGLACLLRTGTWKDIRYFNRPVVLELVTANGKQHHLIVRYLQDDVATLVISGQTYEFSTEKINDFWLGQFLLLWQPPMLPVPLIRVGVTNDAVLWIRKHLNIIEGRSNALETFDTTLSPRFDVVLKQRVIAFQRKYKLGADGIVGEETMLALQALSGIGNPLLYQIKAASSD
jgi:general secretion pathway protein A